jgi:hypothetical protein
VRALRHPSICARYSGAGLELPDQLSVEQGARIRGRCPHILCRWPWWLLPITGGAGKEPYPAILDQARRNTEVPARHMRLMAAASTEKTSTRPIGDCPTAVYGDYRSIVVRALAARSPDLLGRAKRSSPKAARLRAAGAGLDGESADRAIIMSLRCASSSDTVREIEYQILHVNVAVVVVATPHFASPTSWLPIDQRTAKRQQASFDAVSAATHLCLFGRPLLKPPQGR